jgi:hypothetical protein
MSPFRLSKERTLKSKIQNVGQTAVRAVSTDAAEDSRPDTDTLIRNAHRVLVHYLPGASLPKNLSRVRAMLDAHMFGRDKRAHRDDVVEVARQIDRMLPARIG